MKTLCGVASWYGRSVLALSDLDPLLALLVWQESNSILPLVNSCICTARGPKEVVAMLPARSCSCQLL